MEKINQQKGIDLNGAVMREQVARHPLVEEIQPPHAILGQAAIAPQAAAGEQALGSPTDLTADYEPYDPANDPFPWDDAAEWNPWQAADDTNPENLHTALDESLGDPATTDWYGLRRHVDGPGGVVLYQNPCGMRGFWSTPSDEALAWEWNSIQREHQAFERAVRTPRPEDPTRDPRPEILIGVLHGSDAGHFHGAWLDPAVDVEALDRAIGFIMRNSCQPDAEECAVFAYRGFPYGVDLALGECPDVRTLSKVAKGIEGHGLAFAAWAAYVGVEDDEALDQFSQRFHGEFQSPVAHAEHLLATFGSKEAGADAPSWLRPFLHLNGRDCARELASHLHIVEAPNGRTWVFDADY
ncbi:antirestriction protein ArdA [Allorhizocola rhizosphaerae]|uniref:antirestriction protein ArdA n=1 Tax=Allorhizocola rhizosphaerae TaxID=1872709 RepID=UPI000E3BE89A|nr:antirestriction protein ArdA [Allorhizocola rhizosphaerae]